MRVGMDKDYETVNEAAGRLGIDKSMVRRYCEQNRIPGAIKPHPRLWLIPKGAEPTTKSFGRPQTWKGSNG